MRWCAFPLHLSGHQLYGACSSVVYRGLKLWCLAKQQQSWDLMTARASLLQRKSCSPSARSSEAHGIGDQYNKKGLVFDYLRLMCPILSSDLDLAFMICNVNALSQEIVPRSNLESPALSKSLRVTSPLSFVSTSSASVSSRAKTAIAVTSLARSALLIQTTCLVIRCAVLCYDHRISSQPSIG
jgi:hypothetical protein